MKPKAYLTAAEAGLLAASLKNGAPNFPPYVLHLAYSAVQEPLSQLFDDEVKYRRNETDSMAQWQMWTPRIADATPDHLEAMVKLYDSVVVPGEALTGLIDPNDAARHKAYNTMRYFAGFLHDDAAPDRNIGQYLKPNGVSVALTGMQDELLGYYTVKTDSEQVQRSLGKLGWRSDLAYVSQEDLPSQTVDGNPLTFMYPDFALEIMRAAKLGKVALPGVLVVSPVMKDSIMMRNLGQGKALKVQAYRQLDKMGIEYTLTYIYQIEAVGLPGHPLQSISVVHNQQSETINRDTRAEMVALQTEEFTRRDGVSLRVKWGLWASRVKELISHVDGDAPPMRGYPTAASSGVGMGTSSGSGVFSGS